MVATILAVAEMAIIGVNTEDNGDPQKDAITFILLKPIGSGTIIFFTDRNWNGSVFAAAGGGDGTFTYTAATDLPAGTVITITQAQLTTAGMNLSDAGDTIYAYQGAINAPTVFLHAVDIADGNTTFNGSLVNTGLVAGTSAVAIAVDNAEMGTRSHNINALEYFGQVNNNTDWVQNDNSPQDGTVAGTPTLVAPNSMLLVAGSGAGEAIVTINLDATYNSGTIGYQIVQAFQNLANLFHPSDITLDTVHDKYFFVDADLNGNNRLIQGSISELLANPGGTPTFLVLYSNTGTGAVNSMRTLSVDTVNQKIYFDVAETFVRINYDTQNQVPTVLADLGAAFPVPAFITQMTINYTTGTVYLGSSAVTSVFGSDAIESNRVYVATGLTGSNAAGSMTFTPINWGANGNLAIGPEGDSGFGIHDNTYWPEERGTIRGVDVDPVTGLLWIVTGTVILDNQGDGLNTYYGGVWNYNPSTGVVTNVYTQNGVTGPVGLLYYIEVDNVTGRYYVVDEFGANAVVGDGGVWSGSLGGPFPATPTLLATVGNINGLGPQGLEIQHAPTLTGTGLTPTITETSGNPSPNPTAVQPASTFQSLDADSGTQVDQLAGAQVRISNNFQSGTGHQDQLTINGTTSGTIELGAKDITYSYNATLGVMTLSGVQTLDNYEAALALVRYRVDGDNPTNYGTAGSRTLSYSTFDGLLYSDEVHATVTVVGVNDAPVNVVPGAQTFNEDTAKVFSTANANALSVSDVDADPATQALVVTLSATQGTLTLASLTGLSFSAGDGTADTTMTFSGTANAINAALGLGLTFNPIADYNGAAALTFTVNDQGFNGNDPGLSGTGTTEQDSDTIALTINAVVDIANDSPSFAEDSGAQTIDVLANDTFENAARFISAVSQGTHGTVTIVDGPDADGIMDYLTYTPNADYNGSDSFTYTVTSGGVTETATVNVTVTAVADIANDAATVGEDSGATTVDVLANDSFENAARFVSAVSQGTNGTVAIVDGPDADGIMDFVTYTPNADFNGSDSFTYTVTSGGVTETATVNVTVNAVADIAADSVTVLEDSGANSLDLLANDSFESAGRAITAATQPANGTTSINNNGTPANATDDFVVFTPNANFNGATSFNYTVTSGGVTETALVSVTVTAVNDAPTSTNLQGDSERWFEGAGQVLLDSANNATIADIDSLNFDTGTLTVSISAGKVAAEDELGIATTGGITVAGSSVKLGATTFATFTGGGGGGADLVFTFDADATPAAVQALVRAIFYTNTGGENPTDGNRTITWTLVDGDGIANSGQDTLVITSTMDVDPINDPPAGADNSDSVVELQTYTFNVADFSTGMTDVESHAFASAVITTLPTGGTIFFDSDAGGPNPPVAISAGHEVTAAQLAAGQLTYVAPAFAGGPTRTFTFQVRDNGGTLDGGVDLDASANTFTFNIQPANAAPVLDLNGAAAGIDNAATYTENANSTALAPGLTITDADDTNIESALVRITAGKVTGDFITVNGTTGGTVNGITYLSNSSAGTLTFTGSATLAQYQALLRQVGFESLSHAPGTSRTIEWKVNDGSADSAAATTTITVTEVNDAPVNTVPGDQTGTEDTDLVFSTANGNAIRVADVDGDNLTVTLSVLQGTLRLTAATGLTVTGDGTSTLQISGGNAAAINAALQGLTYRGAANYFGSDTLTVHTSDGTLSDQDTVGITLADEPVIHGTTGNDTHSGTANNDVFDMSQGGDDTVSGLGGNDLFFFGAALTGADSVDGGPGTDTLVLQGDYNLTLGAGQLTGIERLVLLSGAPGTDYDYVLATTDAAVAAGTTLTVRGTGLAAAEVLVFNGTAETDASFILLGGAGDDILAGGQKKDFIRGGAGDDQLFGRGDEDYLIGGLGADQLRGGASHDRFVYESAADSTAAARDHIVDFQIIDRIDLSAIDADGNGANGDTAFTFIGSGAFTNVAGQLRATNVGNVWTVEGDVNGDGVADLVITVTTVGPDPLTGSDFLL